MPQSELQNLEKQTNMSRIREHETDSEPLQCLLIGLLKTSNYLIILGYEIWKKSLICTEVGVKILSGGITLLSAKFQKSRHLWL